MKKIKMAKGVNFTFEKGCNKYLETCRQRNLRDVTILNESGSSSSSSLNNETSTCISNLPNFSLSFTKGLLHFMSNPKLFFVLLEILIISDLILHSLVNIQFCFFLTLSLYCAIIGINTSAIGQNNIHRKSCSVFIALEHNSIGISSAQRNVAFKLVIHNL